MTFKVLNSLKLPEFISTTVPTDSIAIECEVNLVVNLHIKTSTASPQTNLSLEHLIGSTNIETGKILTPLEATPIFKIYMERGSESLSTNKISFTMNL